MTRNMFRDVIDPSITVGGKRGYTVPLSIVAHTAILAALIVMPLLATGSLPAPPTLRSFFTVTPTPLPPAPPAAPRTSGTSRVIAPANPDRAPVTAPDDIAPEH